MRFNERIALWEEAALWRSGLTSCLYLQIIAGKPIDPLKEDLARLNRRKKMTIKVEPYQQIARKYFFHLSFDVTTPMLKGIRKIEGVDKVEPYTRYSFLVTVGYLFAWAEVEQDIRHFLERQLPSLNEPTEDDDQGFVVEHDFTWDIKPNLYTLIHKNSGNKYGYILYSPTQRFWQPFQLLPDDRRNFDRFFEHVSDAQNFLLKNVLHKSEGEKR